MVWCCWRSADLPLDEVALAALECLFNNGGRAVLPELAIVLTEARGEIDVIGMSSNSLKTVAICLHVV